MEIKKNDSRSEGILHEISLREPDFSEGSSYRRVKYDHYIDYNVFSVNVFDLISPGRITLNFDEWGIWPSSENWFLFDTLSRLFFNKTHRLEVMFFEEGEENEARTFLQLGLQFGWGGICISNEDRWFRFNHDGFGLIKSDKDILKNIKGIHGISVDE